jgi:hypothetical protein
MNSNKVLLLQMEIIEYLGATLNQPTNLENIEQ